MSEDIGVTIHKECWQNSESHIEATDCIHEKMLTYEKSLKNLEEESFEEAKDFDKTFTPTTSLFKQRKNTSQFFHDYMESQCGEVRIQYLTGNGAGDAHMSCKITFMDLRIKHLKRTLRK